MAAQPDKWRGEFNTQFPDQNERFQDAVGLPDGGFALVHQDAGRILITRFAAFGEVNGLDRFPTAVDGGAASAPKIALLSNGDVINTFAHGDKIDLSATDARTNLADDQAFTFSGAAAFSGAAGQLRFDMNNISPTGVKAYLVQGDVNGDRVADFTLQIFTAPTVDRPGQPQVFNIFAFDFIL